MQTFSKKQSGIVMLYALLIITLITAIGIGISVVIVKELRLTQNVHYATLAYYAAESGVEKALYTVKISRETKELDETITKIKNYKKDGDFINFENDASYDDSLTDVEVEKKETSLEKDQFTQVDLYNVKDPQAGSGVESIMISWSADPGTWLEVSYVEWDPKNLLFIPETQAAFKEFYSTVDSPKTINIIDPAKNYRLRIKPLYNGVSNLIVTAYSEADAKGVAVNIPSRLLIKSVGEMGEFKQAITALVPWNVPLFGLYDYVLYSEGAIEKKIVVGEPIYTTGAIQVEEAIQTTGSCKNCVDTPNSCSAGGTCFDCGWLAEACTCNASCNIDTYGNGVCKLDSSSTSWQLPIPSSVSANDKYYLNIRFKNPIAAAGDKTQVIINNQCIGLPGQGGTDFVSCTIDSPQFVIYPQHCFNGSKDEDETGPDTGGSCPATPLLGNKIEFEYVQGEFDIDWYQLSTYKIFDDCSDVIKSCPSHPSGPSCLNNTCELCETCIPAPYCPSQTCRVPRCSDGVCDNDTFMPDGSQHTGFCDQEKERCCSGACTNLACVNNSHCDDTNNCTIDTCNYDGICSASCDNNLKCDGTTCAKGSSDWCTFCPHSCGDTYCNCGESPSSCKQDCCLGEGGTNACVANNACYPTDTCHPDAGNPPYTFRGQKCSSGSWIGSCGDTQCQCGETSGNCLADCPPTETLPNKEYLRYIAGDENDNTLGNNLSSLSPAGYSMRKNVLWTPQTGDTSQANLYGVWAKNASNVWAVGGFVTNHYEKILYYNVISGWTTQRSTNSGITLMGVWGASDAPSPTSPIWVTGSSRTILYSIDGANWSPYNTSSLPNVTYRGIYGTSANNIWAVGGGGTDNKGVILHYNGTTWTAISSPDIDAGNWRGVWINSATGMIWVVGDWAASKSINSLYCLSSCDIGSNWKTDIKPPAANENLYSVTGFPSPSNDKLWIPSGSTNRVYYYNGTTLNTWNTLSNLCAPAAPFYTAIAVNETNPNVWALGQTGIVCHCEGITNCTSTSWETQNLGVTHPVYGSSAVNINNIWAVGVPSSPGASIIYYGDGARGRDPANPTSADTKLSFAAAANQYIWYTKEFSNLQISPTPPYNVDLYITDKTSITGARWVDISLIIGYCHTSDNCSVKTAAMPSAVTFRVTSGTPLGINVINLNNVTQTNCTGNDCRLYLKIDWKAASTAGISFKIGVNGSTGNYISNLNH